MKKLIFLFAFLATGLIGAQAQTLVDGENHIEVQYASGDTVFRGTGIYADVELYMKNGDEIYILTGQKWFAGDRMTRIPSYKPSDYGYSSGRELANFLVPRYFQEYRQVYHYTDGNLDTVKYYYDDILQKLEVYTYSAGVVSSKEFITP